MMVAQQKININDVIQKGRPSMALSLDWYVLCKIASKSIDHLFLHCPAAFFLWSNLVRTFKLGWAAPPASFSVFLEKLFRVKSRGKSSVLWDCGVKLKNF